MKSISIGNDIVDLKAHEPDLHPRYIGRVFTPSEIAHIGNDKSKLWLHWSAKEAAYKATKRLFPKTVFSPKKFEYKPELSIVRFEKFALPCRNISTNDYVYTFCSTQKNLLNKKVGFNWIEETKDERSPSTFVRDLAKQKISSLLNIQKSEIEISPPASLQNPNADQIPTLMIRKQVSENLLSFSHHGRFVASYYLNLTSEEEPPS